MRTVPANRQRSPQFWHCQCGGDEQGPGRVRDLHGTKMTLSQQMGIIDALPHDHCDQMAPPHYFKLPWHRGRIVVNIAPS